MMKSGFVPVSLGQAERDLQRICQEKQVQCQVPMKIELLAQRHSATIVAVPQLKTKFGIVGGVGKNPFKKIEADFAIYVEKSVADGEAGYYHETIAEELSHIIYDKCDLVAMRSHWDILELHQRNDWVERESNRESVGRVFCMPMKLLEMELPAVYQSTIDQNGWGPHAFEVVIHAMALRFSVTDEGMRIRLNECTDLVPRIHKSLGAQSDSLLAIFPQDMPRKKTRIKSKHPSEYPLLDYMEGVVR
jgi:hypothetical protein